MKGSKIAVKLYTCNDAEGIKNMTQLMFNEADNGFEKIDKDAQKIKQPPTPHLIYLTILN